VQLLRDDDRSAIATSTQAQQVARAVGLRSTALHARITELSALQALGRVREGRIGFDEALAEATHDLPREVTVIGGREVNHPALVLLRLTHNAAFGLVAHGWPARALEYADRGLATIQRWQLGDGYRSGLLGHRALALLALGEETGVRAVLRQLPRLPQSRVRVSAIEAELGHALLHDDLAAASAHLERAVHFDELLTPLHLLRVELETRRGQHETAATRAQDLIDRLEGAGMVPYVAGLAELGIAARAALLSGRGGSDPARVDPHLDSVRRLLTAAERAGDRCSDGPLPPDTAVRLALARARAGELLPELPAGPAAWQRAHELAGATELRLLQIRAATGLGRSLAADGERSAAAEVLAEARALAVACGDAWHLRMIDTLVHRARLDHRDRRGDHDDPARRLGLTPREVEVLWCLVDGMTNKEIGERLYISTKTASVHVSNILAKLAVDNRRAAALRAGELGLERPPASA
jgi:DNA-binding CsgD family transcriptional regulator